MAAIPALEKCWLDYGTQETQDGTGRMVYIQNTHAHGDYDAEFLPLPHSHAKKQLPW